MSADRSDKFAMAIECLMGAFGFGLLINDKHIGGIVAD
jgi:hypothetical protein